jgi:hypothetical protein
MLDGLHEELNLRVNKPVTRNPIESFYRNKGSVQDLAEDYWAMSL